MRKTSIRFAAAFVAGLFWALPARAQPTSAPARRPTTAPATTTGAGFDRWEKEIAAYETKDREAPPPKHAVLFIGSSTIRLWKTLAQDFPDQPVINRGFGGSEIADSTHFADRIIFPYEPKQIFLRAGGNDIHAGKSPEQVFANFKDFVKTVRAKLPAADIVFISLSPAPSRWAERDATKALNAMIKEYSATAGFKYVETYDMTLTPAGEARQKLFVADKLHFNEEGYKLFAERVRPFVVKP